MKARRFTEEQIIGILREQEARAKTADSRRKHGIGGGTDEPGTLVTGG
jgi:putative transposase